MFKEYGHFTDVHSMVKLTSYQAREIVSQSTGLEQTRVLAQEYVDKAIEAISSFPESDAKNGLIEMSTKVMQRRK